MKNIFNGDPKTCISLEVAIWFQQNVQKYFFRIGCCLCRDHCGSQNQPYSKKRVSMLETKSMLKSLFRRNFAQGKILVYGCSEQTITHQHSDLFNKISVLVSCLFHFYLVNQQKTQGSFFSEKNTLLTQNSCFFFSSSYTLTSQIQCLITMK